MTSTTTTSIGAQVAHRAERFAATLDTAQRADLMREFRAANLRNWSNYPQQVLGRRHRRLGLSTASLDDTQWTALDELLSVALGSGAGTGLDRIHGHLAADDYLLDIGGTHGYGRGEFTIALLGSPSTVGTWTLQFGGHHLAVTLTYDDGELAGATPAFRGIEPVVAFARDGRRWQPEQQSHTALIHLLAALDADQRSASRLHGSHDDVLLGPGKDWSFPKKRAGLAGRDLDEAQRALLLAAIDSFVADVDDESAARILARYAAELDDTVLGWSGSTQLRFVGDYVRIDGPSVWLEWSMHDGIVCAGPHPHAVWRDRGTDYGNTRF